MSDTVDIINTEKKCLGIDPEGKARVSSSHKNVDVAEMMCWKAIKEYVKRNASGMWGLKEAQLTPSALNAQGWKVVRDGKKQKEESV